MSTARFISIGTRGTSIPKKLKKLEPGLEIGSDLTIRWDRTIDKLGKKVDAFVSKRFESFQLYYLEEALRTGRIRKIEGATWIFGKKLFRGEAFLPASWKIGDPVPQYVAVLAPGWPHGRVEGKLRDDNLNHQFVAKLELPRQIPAPSRAYSPLAHRSRLRLKASGSTTPANWSEQEVEAIVTDYFAMLADEIQDKPYNKAEHNRNLQKLLNNRDRTSIEFKHRNISAVLWHLGFPYIDGYKPLPRYQALLRHVVEARLARSSRLNRLVAKSVTAQATTVPPIRNLRAIQVQPPKRKEVKLLIKDESRRRTAFIQRNYLEVEAKNQSLGRAGEEFILRFEHERLWRSGKRRLANRVEHVAASKGDYLGYDIHSFETNGCEKLIEVKTTRYGALTRFFASLYEIEVSHKEKDTYQLYRLFSFDKQPKFFVLPGSLRETCELKPVTFSAVPN